jgi:hypothetical protein
LCGGRQLLDRARARGRLHDAERLPGDGKRLLPQPLPAAPRRVLHPRRLRHLHRGDRGGL